MKLNITSVFFSINGEVCYSGQGSWTTFIRFSGCSATCPGCDSKYSWEQGKELSAKEIISIVQKKSKGCKNITITGGEPLEQFNGEFILLLNQLTMLGYQVSIETNGVCAEAITTILKHYPTISLVVDYKLPSSGKVHKKMSDALFTKLPKSYFIKFVIATLEDFDWAMAAIKNLGDKIKAKIYFSPSSADPNLPKYLFDWMKSNQLLLLKVGYNLQIHKIIFPHDWRDEEISK